MWIISTLNVKKFEFLGQGRKWLFKAGLASSNVAHRRCPVAPSILPKPWWAIAHPARPPAVTPLLNINLLRKIK